MDELRLLRDERPIEGTLFVATPYGKKELADGTIFDFDAFFELEIAPVAEAAGYKPVRADNIYGPQSVMAPIWRGIQQGEAVLIDFTNRSANVAMEYALAMLIGKKCVYLTQDPEDIPTDVRGRLRYIRYSDRYQDVSRMREELRQQLVAIRSEPTVEMAIVPMAAGGTDPVPATVITVTPEFAVIEASGGRRGVLGNTDVDYNRIVPDMTKLYAVGDRVAGAFDVDTGGGMKYTLLAGIPNPWPRLRAELPAGTTLSGIVRRTREGIGAFVEVRYGIDGLIHASTLAGRPLGAGDQVVVSIARIDSDRRRISLHLDQIVESAGTPVAALPDSLDGFRPGQIQEAEVAKVVRQDEGGYLLVRLPGRTRPAMLHSTAMTPELRTDFARGDVEDGEVLDVEILKVDAARDRITVRDVPETAQG